MCENKNERICCKCGAELPLVGAFCRVCGTSFAALPPAQDIAKVSFCLACGAELPPVGTFCRACGMRQPKNNIQPTRKKKSRNKLIVMIVIVVLLVLGGAGHFMGFYKIPLFPETSDEQAKIALSNPPDDVITTTTSSSPDNEPALVAEQPTELTPPSDLQLDEYGIRTYYWNKENKAEYVTYEGYWKNDLPNGAGKITSYLLPPTNQEPDSLFSTKQEIEGNFIDGYAEGSITLTIYLDNGEVLSWIFDVTKGHAVRQEEVMSTNGKSNYSTNPSVVIHTDPKFWKDAE